MIGKITTPNTIEEKDLPATVSWDSLTEKPNSLSDINYAESVQLNVASVGISDLAIQGWQFDGTFSASDNDTIAWTSGTLRFKDGTTFAISAGNTGNISAVNYIYFSRAASTTVLQVTTTAASAVGANKVLMCVCQNVAVGKKATFQVFGGSGGVGTLITADNIAANSITANEIASNTITAAQIAAGTITADRIQSGSITTTQLNFTPVTAGGSAADINAYATKINGTQIVTGSITADQIQSNTLTVGTNVGLGTAQTASQVTTIVGNTITTAYVNALNITTANLSASSITSGTITIGGTSQPSNLTIVESSSGSAGSTTSLLNWKSSGGTLRGKIWSDSSGYMGYNSIGGRHYFYTNSNENVVIQDGAQTIFNQGISCRGSFNVGVPGGTTQNARFNNNVYFDNGSSTTEYIWGGSQHLDLGAYSYISLLSTEVRLNWLTATGASPQIGTSGARFYLYGSTVRYTTLTNDSDIRLKKNVIDSDYGLAEIEKLKPIKYEYKKDDEGVHIGFSAQDVEKIMPELVSEDEGVKCISTIEMIPTLVKAIQELSAKIVMLEKNKVVK